MEASPGNRRVLELLDGASRDLGLGPVGPAAIHQLGAADVSFAAPHVAGAIDGLGLGGRGGHSVSETADLRTLAIQAKRAAALMMRLSEGAFEEGR
jgi:glutamate carboxypeptidase